MKVYFRWRVYDEASATTHLTKDDPPVFMIYNEPDGNLPPDAQLGQGIHHPPFRPAVDAQSRRARHPLGVSALQRKTAIRNARCWSSLGSSLVSGDGLRPGVPDGRHHRPDRRQPGRRRDRGFQDRGPQQRTAGDLPRDPAHQLRATCSGNCPTRRKPAWKSGRW